MPRGKSTQDLAMLAMALVGYEVEKKKIEERIQEVRALLAGGAADDGDKPRRKLSMAARKRIAAAQRKRWAAVRKASAQNG
jgi:hypothetical protein